MTSALVTRRTLEAEKQKEFLVATSIAEKVNILDSKEWLLAETKKKLYILDDNPGRKIFFDRYFDFANKNGIKIKKIPVVAKLPLDLFKLYVAVQNHGGLSEVVKQRSWNIVVRELELPLTITSAAYTLREKYFKLLYPFEKWERKIQYEQQSRAEENEISAEMKRKRKLSEASSSTEFKKVIVSSSHLLMNNRTPIPMERIIKHDRMNNRTPILIEHINQQQIKKSFNDERNGNILIRNSDNEMNGNVIMRNGNVEIVKRIQYRPSTKLEITNVQLEYMELEFYTDGRKYSGYLCAMKD